MVSLKTNASAVQSFVLFTAAVPSRHQIGMSRQVIGMQQDDVLKATDGFRKTAQLIQAVTKVIQRPLMIRLLLQTPTIECCSFLMQAFSGMFIGLLEAVFEIDFFTHRAAASSQ